MAVGDIKEEFYEGTTFTKLKDLEERVQADESHHSAKLTEFVLAQQDNKHGTKGKFTVVRPRDFKLGLIFRAFDTEGQARLIEAQLESEGHTKLFRDTVLIGDERTTITIFRKKQEV